MKILLASALLIVLGGVEAKAQVGVGMMGGPASPARVDSAQIKLLQIEQEVDETLLREALLTLGRKDLRPSSEQAKTAEARDVEQYDAKKLADFIEARKEAIIKRTAEIRAKRIESAAPTGTATHVTKPADQVESGQSEEIEKARIEIQLLQAQVQLSQNSLAEAIKELAKLEHSTDNDLTPEGNAESIRKQFEKAKENHIKYSKRLREEIAHLNAIDPMSPFRGMSGGMGGMGGMGSMGGMM